ncbi:P-selectin glycoprotein ligand 1 isoform X2 [Hyla sarda]|nr:P-selectin glycoprotein ligand 1 isoform X2 [Hyla sarda]
MTLLLKALLICLWLSPAIAYKLPLLNEAILTDDDNTDKPNNSPFGMNYKWEWQSQDRMDEGTLMLTRLRRDTYKMPNKGEVVPDKKVPPKVKATEPPLDELSDSTPYILEASSAASMKVKSILILNQDKTTTLTDPEQATKGAGQKADEDETTPLTNLEKKTEGTGNKLEEDKTPPFTDQTTKGAGEELIKEETTHVDKSVTQLKTLVTELNPTISEKLSVSTSNKYKKATTDHSTNSQDTSDHSTSPNETLVEDITSSISPNAQETSPSTTPVISHDPTTGHDVTTVRFLASSGSSAKPAAVTHVTSFSEDKIHTQSIMRQCMLTILILAV